MANYALVTDIFLSLSPLHQKVHQILCFNIQMLL